MAKQSLTRTGQEYGPGPDDGSSFSTFISMVRKELIIMARYPVEFVASFGQVFLIVAVFTLAGSTFTRGIGGNAGSSGDYTGIVIYGFILFLFLSDTLWNIGYNVRREQIQGTLEQLYLSPASKFASLVSRVVNILIWTGLLSLTGMWVMVKILGSLPLHNLGLGLYLFVFSLLGTFGVGFAFAALTLRIKETANTLANFLQFGLLILCANFFPFSALPEPVLYISRLIPLSYCVDAFRSTLMGYPPGFPELAPIGIEIVIVTAFGLLMPILGYLFYRKSEIYARKRGSLTEF
jgi:ABC-2 type transport system permease protein